MSRRLTYTVACLAFLAGAWLYARTALAQTNPCPNMTVDDRYGAPQDLCSNYDLVI